MFVPSRHMTLHRRWGDIIFTSCACRVVLLNLRNITDCNLFQYWFFVPVLTRSCITHYDKQSNCQSVQELIMIGRQLIIITLTFIISVIIGYIILLKAQSYISGREWPKKIFHDQSPQKNVANPVRVEPATSWSPVRCAAIWAIKAGVTSSKAPFCMHYVDEVNYCSLIMVRFCIWLNGLTLTLVLLNKLRCHAHF